MLKLEKINKRFGGFSLHNIDIRVERGDYYMLIGETGAGKSMVLDIITGLLKPDCGNIFLDGKNMRNTPPQKRNIGIVYQKPTLFPHMTVFENIAYPLKIKKLKKGEIKTEVKMLAKEVDIEHLLERNIANLSGGEAQRVTIARTLATKPVILLLDEPLSFLDVQLKRDMSVLLRRLNQKGITIIHVTHDYAEAISLANKIGFIEKGTIIQTGSPQEVFNRPQSAFVANFVGIRNFFKGKLTVRQNDPDLKIFETSGFEIQIFTDEDNNTKGSLIIPSEAITISDEQQISSVINNFYGTILDVFQTYRGVEVIVEMGSQISIFIPHDSPQRLDLSIGRKVWINIHAGSVVFLKSNQ